MEQPLGPFAVTPTQITRLGEAFTPFVNALLRVEVAAAGLSGSVITTTYQENIGDEGVDAGLCRAAESRFIPAGDSAWQFKRGDLPPAKCKIEIASATAALEILRLGGKYRLVLGSDINYAKAKNRRKALREAVTQLGINIEDDSIEVLTASDLAEWAQSRPSLAVSQLLGGIRGSVEDFYEWAGSGGVSTKWVDSPARQAIMSDVRKLVETSDRSALHVEGVSGLGKSRTVLEAFRGQPYESLVIYVRDADAFPPSLVRYLTGEGRTAILVVDDCDPKQHKNLTGALPADSGLKLLTIGEPGPSRDEGKHLKLPPMEDTAMAEILKLNRPNLWPEASQFVTDVAAGNVRLGLVLAEAVERQPRSSAATLITRDIIEVYVTEALPVDTSFLACCALSLFTRIGYEEEAAVEIQLLSEVVNITETELRASARTLAELGLLASKGRFRSLTPQPLAVYLASQGWDEFGHRINEFLLPRLRPDLAERLLQRAAEIGPNSAVLHAVDSILDREELFGSLSSISASGFSQTLQNLAILAPRKVSIKLSEVISSATDDELRTDHQVRRSLVWTLEKLAWHSNTFQSAANALLRLATNEIETYGNNATGAWCSLFGALLPSTAALPRTRLAYLRRVSSSEDSRERALAAKAASGVLEVHQSVMVSAERQRGVLVEPRGRPGTYGEVWEYQRAAIQILRHLVDDEDQTIAAESLNALIDAIHPFLEHQAVRGDLFAALKSLPEDSLNRVRTEITHLQGLFRSVTNVEGRQAGLDLLIAELPKPSELDELQSLVYARRWDLEEGELQRRIKDAAQAVNDAQGTEPMFAMFADELPAAYELGQSLAAIAPSSDTLAALTPLAEGKNSPALVGYLWGMVEDGDTVAFDSFLDSAAGLELDSATRLSITVRGPQSDAGWQRAEQLIGVLSVDQGVRGLFGWRASIEESRLSETLTRWMDRIESQNDYNAVVDFMGMALFKKPDWIEGLDDKVAQLVQLRSQFPDVGQESWDWVQLAKRQVPRQSMELLRCLLTLIDSGALRAYGPGGERDLLKMVFQNSGAEEWDSVASSLASGSWLLQMDARGWIVEEFSADIVTGWIGDNVERAKLVARVASAGGKEPTPVARYLLDRFGNESKVTGPLAGEFWGGSGFGSFSDQLSSQIDQLQDWINSPVEPEAVKQWAREMILSLEDQRDRALRQEAEEDFS